MDPPPGLPAEVAAVWASLEGEGSEDAGDGGGGSDTVRRKRERGGAEKSGDQLKKRPRAASLPTGTNDCNEEDADSKIDNGDGGRREKAIFNLSDAFKSVGCHVSEKLAFRLDRNEGGVFAGEDIAKGELLVRVPEHATIAPVYAHRPDRVMSDSAKLNTFLASSSLTASSPTSNSTSSSPSSSSPQPRSTMTNYERTLLRLLFERRNAESKFKTYLDSLPSRFSTPLWWSSEAKTHLKGTEIGSIVLNDQTEKRFFETILPTLEKAKTMFGWEKDPDYEEFKWAASVICTRGYHNGSNGPYLIPFIDQFNHSSISWATKLKCAAGVFLYIAERDIKKGEEIFTKYGDYGNAQLLHTYGFVEMSLAGEADTERACNPFDKVSIGIMDCISEAASVLSETDEQIPIAMQDLTARIGELTAAKITDNSANGKEEKIPNSPRLIVPGALDLTLGGPSLSQTVKELLTLCFLDEEQFAEAAKLSTRDQVQAALSSHWKEYEEGIYTVVLASIEKRIKSLQLNVKLPKKSPNCERMVKAASFLRRLELVILRKHHDDLMNMIRELMMRDTTLLME